MKDNAAKETTIGEWTEKLLLILFDIFAVNFSYYIALVIRFYVDGEFHLAGTLFMPLFLKFAPYYTVCCILVFFAAKLYSGVWRYAGRNDVIRIAAACFVTCLIQIFGTLLFVRRMPITYYAIGAVIQFFLVLSSRFATRIVTEETARVRGRKNLTVNVMVVGAGETASLLLRQFDSNEDNMTRAVCVVNPRGSEKGKLFNGLPVVGGIEEIPAAAEKYAVKSVVIADSLIPIETRKEICKLCGDLKLTVSNFSGYVQGALAGISLSSMLAAADGPMEIVLDGASECFDNGEQAAASLPGHYVVKTVSVRGERLVLEIQKNESATNMGDWAAAYERETGEQISFF